MSSVSFPPDIEWHHFDTAVHVQYHYRSPLTIRRILGQLRLTLGFLWTCYRLRPTVLHLTSSYDAGWIRDSIFLAWAHRLGTSTILNLRGGDFERFYRGLAPRKQLDVLRTLARCAAITPITRDSSAFLRTLGLEQVHVIPNCVSLGSLPAREARPSEARWRWLYVGWIMPGKGIVELLEALRAVPDAELTLIGPLVNQADTDMTLLMQTALTDPILAGRLTHVPGVPMNQVRRRYTEHDIFVFPTHREGFPNVVLEAMEAGVPIVATRVGAIPDMVRDEMEALLVPPCDIAALVHAIRRLQREPLLGDRLAQAARKRVEAEFGLKAVSELWFALYRKVSVFAKHEAG